MEISVQLGWWLIPAMVTLAAIGGFAWYAARTRSPFGYSGLFDGILGLLILAVAVIVTLLAWLIWALFN